MKTKTIRQSVIFKANPKDVYAALMVSAKHSSFTGSKAVISKKIGGKFSVYGGGLTGTNLKLVPGKKIIQSWRAEMKGWPKQHYSTVKFLLKKSKADTKLTLVHSGVPVICSVSIAKGWHEYYWKRMKKFLGY